MAGVTAFLYARDGWPGARGVTHKAMGLAAWTVDIADELAWRCYESGSIGRLFH